MIIGYSGSGKSTLARFVSEAEQLPLLHLDSVQFTANWEERDKTEARQIVAEFLKQDGWVIDGNYSDYLYEQRLAEADRIIFLNFPRWTCLRRVMMRNKLYKGRTRPDMASGCIEKLDLAFIWWILYKGRNGRKRQQYEAVLEQYGDKVAVISNQEALDAFYLSAAENG